MKTEPSDREKVLSMNCVGELEGARGQFQADGRLTDELNNLIALRKQMLRRTP
jgi:hypothetical protein